MKKFLIFAFVLMLALSLAACNGNGDSNSSTNDVSNNSSNTQTGNDTEQSSKRLEFALNTDEKSYCVNGFGACTDTDIVVPSTYNGLPITSIGANAFYNRGDLKSISIGSNVVYIGESAFNGCDNLQRVTMPNSITNIHDSAFYGCQSLTSITIPNSVISIDYGAFEGCSNLKEVHISDIGAWCNISFGNYESNPIYFTKNLYLNGELVTKPVIPDTVNEIKAYTFYNCESLKSITIPNSVKLVGSTAFYGCSNLKEVHISDIEAWCNISFDGRDANPLYCAKNLYLNGKLLTALVIPNTVTEIKTYAFYGCDSLTSITIPNSVTSIGNFAFLGCHKLVEVYNLSDLTITAASYEDNGYVGFYALNVYASLDVPSKQWETEDGFLFYEDGDTCCPLDYNGDKAEITLPESCHGKNYKIYDYAFYCNDKLTKVIIPDGVTSIGHYAFWGCFGLTSIIIPDSVTSIGGYTFDDCESLATVYYTGTDEEWTAISIGPANDSLDNATVYYYSEEEPTEEGNFWYYDADGNIKAW